MTKYIEPINKVPQGMLLDQIQIKGNVEEIKWLHWSGAYVSILKINQPYFVCLWVGGGRNAYSHIIGLIDLKRI